MTTTQQRDPLAFVFQLTPQTRQVIDEYLCSSSVFGDVLENKPATLRQSVLDELALYVDIRHVGEQIELYFKKEQ